MSAHYDLARMRRFLTELGDSQDQLRVIHVADTSGKTSAGYFMREFISATGVSTGGDARVLVVG